MNKEEQASARRYLESMSAADLVALLKEASGRSKMPEYKTFWPLYRGWAETLDNEIERRLSLIPPHFDPRNTPYE